AVRVVSSAADVPPLAVAGRTLGGLLTVSSPAGIRSFNKAFKLLDTNVFVYSCGSAASRASESAGSAPAFAGRTGAFEGALGRAPAGAAAATGAGCLRRIRWVGPWGREPARSG